VWKLPIGTKLYAHPPRREWQGLEAEVLTEREACAKECDAVSASADKAAVDGQYLVIRNGAEARRCAAAIRARSKT